MGGWKVGLTSGKSRDSFGKGIRPFGFVLDNRIIPSDDELNIAAIQRCGIENELCFVMDRELRGKSVTAAMARAAVGGVAPAFEVNETRLSGESDGPCRVADNLSQWGIVVGPETRPLPQDFDWDSLVIALSRDGVEVERVAARGHIDDHFESLAALARELSKFDRGLNAGQRVITGSFTRQPVREPARWEADFGRTRSRCDPFQMKILIIPGLTLPSVSAADLQRIRDAAGPGAELVVTSQAQAHEHAEAAEVILGFVPHALFQAAPRLRWVHAIASGVDAFLYPEFAASPVLLTSEKGLVGEHLADHAFGLLLMLTRQLATALKLGPDAWNHRPEMRRKEIELTGLTMGIVGFGGTGRAMARRAAAFGMRCLAVDRDPVPASAEVPSVHRLDGFLDLLASSDVVAVCVPLTRETQGMFDAKSNRLDETVSNSRQRDARRGDGRAGAGRRAAERAAGRRRARRRTAGTVAGR